jgi:hypothetical protein
MPTSPQDHAARRFDFAGPILLAAVILATTVSLASAYYAPPETGEMGVVYPPWIDEGTAIAGIIAAGGKIVASSKFSNIVVAYAEDDQFHSRVREHGAWFLVAATGLCGPVKEVAP